MKLDDLITSIAPLQKFRPYWTAKLGRAEVTGQDKEEATRALFAELVKPFESHYIPFVISYHGYFALIWRNLSVWEYHILEEGYCGPVVGCNSGYVSREEAEKAVRSHLAQNTWNGTEESSPLIQDVSDQEQFANWTRWQKDYKRLVAEGKSSEEAFQLASGRVVRV